MNFFLHYFSPVGRLTVVGTKQHITGLWIDGQKYFQSTLTQPPLYAPHHPLLQQACDWLDRYFAGRRPLSAELPLAPAGSTFRRYIWSELCRIPYGTVVTYGSLARLAAQKFQKNMSAQAVGGAVGHNPISIIIPCHRVIGSNGSLTGYAGGIDKKLQLLQGEGVDITKLNAPSTTPFCT